MRKGILGIGIAVALLVVYAANFFIPKPLPNSERTVLREENENLRAELQRLSDDMAAQRKDSSSNAIRAKIFSTYPFTIRNQITLSAGAEDGVKNGAAVLAGDAIVIGKVIEVYSRVSVARIIFDAGFQMPVRIGKAEVNGLFRGGSEPKITLIEKSVQSGDVVYAASRDFPFGMKMGEITAVNDAPGSTLKEATVSVPFQIGELREVTLVNGE